MRLAALPSSAAPGTAAPLGSYSAAAGPLELRSAWRLRLFELYLTWLFYRRFHAVRISRAGLPDAATGRPMVIYTNHPSWWDPVLYILLGARLLPDRRGFGPMDAAALGRYGLFRRMGVFGIDPASRRGAADFLRIAESGLRDNADAVLWITAEGRFTDPRSRPLQLRPGIAHLARRRPEAVFLPLAIEYSFWNEPRPEVLVRFGHPIDGGGSRSVLGWTDELEGALRYTMDELALESAARDPALFDTVLGGAAGVGGAYDLIRRARALGTGKRFDPSHETIGRVAQPAHAREPKARRHGTPESTTT